MFESILVLFSLLGNYFNCRKKRLGFVIWILTNVGFIIIDYSRGAYSRCILDAVQIGFSIYGLINWSR